MTCMFCRIEGHECEFCRMKKEFKSMKLERPVRSYSSEQVRPERDSYQRDISSLTKFSLYSPSDIAAYGEDILSNKQGSYDGQSSYETAGTAYSKETAYSQEYTEK